MTDIMTFPWRDRTPAFQFRLKQAFKRWKRAFDYARNRLSEDDAQTIFHDVQTAAGWYPLVVLGVEDVKSDVLSEFLPNPDLDGLCREAAEQVAYKWESSGHELEAALAAACEKVHDYAEMDGVVLLRREDTDCTHCGGPANDMDECKRRCTCNGAREFPCHGEAP